MSKLGSGRIHVGLKKRNQVDLEVDHPRLAGTSSEFKSNPSRGREWVCIRKVDSGYVHVIGFYGHDMIHRRAGLARGTSQSSKDESVKRWCDTIARGKS